MIALGAAAALGISAGCDSAPRAPAAGSAPAATPLQEETAAALRAELEATGAETTEVRDAVAELAAGKDDHSAEVLRQLMRKIEKIDARLGAIDERLQSIEK
ncbi:MAG: hypothetical protein L0Z55_00910 [Planctomycetes bacterium]|nr:hypothetical protein [Planctomycetota bacterium]